MNAQKCLLDDRRCLVEGSSSKTPTYALQVEECSYTGANSKWKHGGDNTLEALLSEAFLQHSELVGTTEADPSMGEPMLEVSFPIMHSYNLELSKVIPSSLCKLEDVQSENGHLLRPCTRLLGKVG